MHRLLPHPPPPSLLTSLTHQVVVVSTARDKLWVSRDAGRNWDNYKLPTTDFAAERDLYLSSIDPRHMVLLSKLSEVHSKMLMLSIH